jgi:hypothetical protein
VAPRLLSKLQNLAPSDINGFEDAVQALQVKLNLDGKNIVPSARDILEGAQLQEEELEEAEPVEGQQSDTPASKGKAKTTKNLGWKAQDALFAEIRAALSKDKDAMEYYDDKDMTGNLQFALQNTTSVTSADFLAASTSNPRNRVHAPHFHVAVRTYLGLPVQAQYCNIGSHNGLFVANRNGDCSGHVRSEVTARHEGLKKGVFSGISHLKKGSGFGIQAYMEVPMTRHHQIRENFVVPKSVDFADFITVDESGHVSVYDVHVVHPDIRKAEHWSAEGAVDEAAHVKHKKYCCWTVDEEDVIPIALSTYKGMAEETLVALKRLAFNIAGGDTDRTNKIVRRLREDIAIQLVWGQGRVIAEINRLNVG